MLKQLYFSLCNFGGTFNMEFTYTGKVSRALGIICTISSFCLNNSSLRTLYYSPVCPYLFYCVGIWASTYPSSLLQKRVVRIMSRSAFDDHTDPSFKSVGILNLESTVYLQTSSAKIYVSLQIRLTSWLLLNNMFLMTRQVHSYGTRSSELFYLPQFGKLSIRENLVVTSAYSVRPSTLWGWWKGIRCQPVAGRSMLQIVLCIWLCNSRFSWQQIAQEIVWPSRRVQKRVYFKNLFPSILSIRICVRSAQFLVNCFEKNWYGNKQ